MTIGTQLGWTQPYHDAQHSGLAEVHGPGNGATTKWSSVVQGREYPLPFTVAARAGHIFTTDRDGTIFAYNALQRASFLWSRRLLNSSMTANGTVDIIPVVVSDGEQERQIVVASCQQLAPHYCVLAVLGQDGNIIWSSENGESAETIETQGRKAAEESAMTLDSIDWSGRIYQPVPVNDGELIVVPMCPRISLNMKNDCRLYAIDPMTGTVKWYFALTNGIIRGDVLLTRSGILLIPMCDFETFMVRHQCLRVFAGIQAENGVLLWNRNWNSTQAFSGYDSVNETHVIGGKELPKTGPFGLQMNSQFTGLVADGIFVTLADDINDNVWAVGTDMASGDNSFLVKLPGATNSRHFFGCAATPTGGKPRQLFFMTSNIIISLDTTGNVIWKNENVSNLVRTMAIDTGGAIYVATTERKSSTQYISTLDVYDAEGGSYSYSLPIPQCKADSPINMTILPSFALSSERMALIMCQGRLYAIYSSIVPIWAWIVLSVAFGLILFGIFVVGFVYHRRSTSRFEELS